jgi:hypothetical protein
VRFFLDHDVPDRIADVLESAGHFLALGSQLPHRGIVILIRRNSRLAESASLLRLIERSGPLALTGNINFA